MIRRLYRKMALLMVMLMMFQILSPSVSALAATNETMLPPSNLTVQMVSPDDAKLTWSSVFGATGYKIYSITDGQLISLGTTTATLYNLNNLPEGSYRYVVSTLNGTDESGPSAPVSFDITYPNMAAPTNFNYTIQNGNDIVLSWTTSQYANSYNVYKIEEDGQKTLVASPTASTYKFTNAPAGTYKYAVSAVNTMYGESPVTAAVQIDLVHPTMAAPATFTATVSAANDVTLRWGAVTYANGYRIYQVIDGEKVLKGTYTGTSVVFSNQPAGEYTYMIHSYSDRFGESVESKEATFVVGTVTMVPPTNFTYKIQNGNDIVLSWGAVTNSNNYKVYQLVDGEKVLKSTVTGTTVTYTNMPAGEYTFIVNSNSNSFGESAEGSIVSFTLDAITMAPPAILTYTVKNINDVVLTWGAVPYANSYKIYQIIDGQKVLKSTVTGTTITYATMPAGEYTYEVYSYSSRFGESALGSQVSFIVGSLDMAAPENFNYRIQNGNDIVLTWDSVANANSYKVYQIVNGQKVLKSTVTGTTVTYTNVPEGDYTYEVYSYSTRFGQSYESSQIALQLVHPVMEPPLNVVQKVKTATEFSLSWDAAIYATNYKVYQIVNGQKILKSTVSTPTVNYTGMAPGDYVFEVHSNSTRFGESVEGTQLSMTLNETIMQEPINPSYTITNGNDITLRWTTVPYATSFKVYQIIDGQKVLKSTVTGTSVGYSNMAAGEYKFVVHSYSNLLGESPDGVELNINLVFPEMAAPGSVTSKIQNGNDIVLTWTAVPYATSYKVYQIIDGQKVLKSTLTSTSVSYTNLPAGDYSYVVHSYSTRFGESVEGAVLDTTLQPVTMLPPTNLTKTIVNGNDIKLTWNASTYATGYKVYQIVDGQRILKSTITTAAVTYTNMPAGQYSYEVTSYSTRFGESPETTKIDLELIWPVVQAPVAKGDIFNANNITLSWPAVTWANEYRVYEVKDNVRQLLYKGNVLSYKIYNLTEEVHKYEVTAYSTRFGESGPSNQIVENIIYPTMQPPVATINVLSQTSARISWDFVTYANGYNIYEVINGQPLLVAGNINNLSYTLLNLAYANHEYYVTSYSNSFGESEASNKVIAKLIVDTEAPVTTANVPSNWTNQAPVNVTLAATDNETGVANTYYSLNGSGFVTGNNVVVNNEGVSTISFYSVDKVGNKEATKTALVKIDKTAPVTTANEIPVWSKEPVTVELEAADALSGVAKTLYSIDDAEYQEGTEFIIPEGSHQVSYYSVDVAGNVEKTKTFEVKIDKTAPVTTNSFVPDWSMDPVAVKLTSNDDFSGVAKTLYAIDGSVYTEGTNFTVAEEGIHQVTYYSVDAAGNVETAKTINVKIDKTGPVITASQVPEWSTEPVSVKLTAADALSGVAKTLYSINGSEYEEGTTFTINEKGSYKVTYYSVDVAGNRETAKTIEVKIDKAAPVTTNSFVPDWSMDPVTVELKSTDDFSGVAKTLYVIDGSEYTEGTKLTIAEEGIHKVTYYSVDAAGNVESAKTIIVKIDKTGPVTTASQVPEWSTEPVSVKLTAADTLSGVAKTLYSINGSEYKEDTAVTISEEGIYKVTYYSVDAAGNVEPSQDVYVKIDKTAPVVMMDLQGEYKLGTLLPITYLAQDNLSGVVTEKMTITGPNEVIGKEVVNGSGYLLDKPGIYNVAVTVTDAAGLSTTFYKKFVVYISANIEVTPKVIKGNSGIFTVRVSLPQGLSTQGFDLDTATLNGVKALNSNNGYYNQAKLGQFKFERSQFNWVPSEMLVNFRGYVDGHLVLGQTVVQVQK